MLIAAWLAAPWRVAARLLTGLARRLSRRPPQRTLHQVLVALGGRRRELPPCRCR
jgi:hypothetical protein